MSWKTYRLDPQYSTEGWQQGRTLRSAGTGNYYIPANITDSLAVIWLTSVLSLNFYTNPLLQEFLFLKWPGWKGTWTRWCSASARSRSLCQCLSSIIACLLLPKSKAGLVKVGRGWAEILDPYLYMCICEHVINYEAKFVFGCLCHVLWCVSFNLSASCSICPCVLLCICVYTVLLCVYVCAGRY